MPRTIAKLAKDEYVLWSTVVDAPVSNIANRNEAIKEWGEASVFRADKNGTSYMENPETIEQCIAGNRAGPNECYLTLDQIREVYKR